MNDGVWTWRASGAAGEEESNLLYEPGNWGDVLKGTWAIALTRALIARKSTPGFRLLDPFAGAPTYPLTESAACRMKSLESQVFSRFQIPFVRCDRLASTAVLVREACKLSGIEAVLQVFDLDEDRRKSWERLSTVEVFSASSGAEVLTRHQSSSDVADLVLLDPYDFFDHWGKWLPQVFDLAERGAVLVYLYNKSPRGAGFREQYRRFRDQLCRRLKSRQVGVCMGRIAADSTLPRAYHEVLLLAPGDFQCAISARLAVATRRLASQVAEQGAFEEFSCDESSCDDPS